MTVLSVEGEWIRHAGISRLADGAVEIETPRAQWAYCVAFPLLNPPNESGELQIEAECGAGVVQFLAVRGNDVLGQVDFAAGEGRARKSIRLSKLSSVVHLVARNGGRHGVAKGVILDLCAVVVDLNAALEPAEPGVDLFDGPEAMAINAARLDHLRNLRLELAGSVIDVGCGVGHLSTFFTERGCEVTCVDARQSNLDVLAERHPAR